MTTALTTTGTDRASGARTAVCGSCGAAFPAILTGGRCPHCRRQLDETEFPTSDDGPLLRWWYANLKRPLFLVLVLAALTLTQAIVLYVLAVRIGH
jgi:predicted amidophosphoribosyltransferase